MIFMNICHPGSSCPSGRIILFQQAQTLSPEPGDHTEAPERCCPGTSYLTPYSQLGLVTQEAATSTSGLKLCPTGCLYRILSQSRCSDDMSPFPRLLPVLKPCWMLQSSVLLMLFPSLFPEGPTCTQGRHELADL